MKIKIIFSLFVLALFLTGCPGSNTTDYSNYNQQQQPQQNQYVGGGCGVAPQSGYSQPLSIATAGGL